MAAQPSSGTDNVPEQIPRQVVYRRYASETRTVEVTSTAPWPAKALQPDPEKESPTFINTKEKPLKWSGKQPCLKEETQTPDENRTTSPKEEATRDKSVSHSILNRDKPNFGEDGRHVGGRRLSLSTRDKIVGGAAMMFADPLDCSKTFSGERRKSEYDVGRLSTVKRESRRLTEPTIEEHKKQSTLRVSPQPTDTGSTLKTEAKRSSNPGSNNKRGVDSPTSTKTVESKPKVTLIVNTDISSGKNDSKPQREKEKKAEENNSFVRPENVKVVENKIQTSSNASGHNATDKVTFKPDPKDSSEGSRLLSGNTIISEKINSQKSNPKLNKSDAGNSLSHSGAFCKPKTQEKEIRDVSKGLHPASENSNQKTRPDFSVPLSTNSLNTSYNEAKFETNKLQTSSETNEYSSASRSANIKDSSLSHPEITNSAFPRSENTICSLSRPDISNSCSPRSKNTDSSLSRTGITNISVPSSNNTDSSLSRTGITNISVPSSKNTDSPVSRPEITNTACPRSENTNSSLSRPEITSSSFPPSETTKSSLLAHADDARASQPKMEGSKIQTTDTSNTSVFHHSADKSKTQQTETSSVSSPKNNSGNDPKHAKEETIPALTGHHRKDQITVQIYPESELQDLSSENKKINNNDSKTRHDVSSTMNSQHDISVCNLTNATDQNRTQSRPREKSQDAIGQNKSKLVTATIGTTISSSKSPHSPSLTKASGLSKTESRDENEKLVPTTLVDSKSHSVRTKSTRTSEKNMTVLAAALHSSLSASQDQRLSDTKVNRGESVRSQSVCCSPKHEPRFSSRESLASRPVTRSKSDVGEGNRGRTAAPARKSCAERRCCGAQSGLLQEAVTLARARSLSRGPPMGSTASLVPKNKSSWSTQRALESEVQQLKRELHMHKAEELRLHREIHKLRSVLQQATSFGEEATATGDPDDGALLTSLQDRHGMAGAAGVPVGASKKQGVSGESCEPESMEVPRHEKDIRSRQLIKAAILDNDFLKNLARSQIRELVDCMYPQRVQAGSYVIREGEAGSHLYVLDDGEMEVLKEGTVLGRMGPGKVFGELAILYNCTRTASIRAVSDLQVWVLDRRAFQQIMMRTGIQRLEDNIAFLRSVPLLRGINDQTLARIADALEPEFYPADEFIVRQGARGNTFFIIIGGSVEVTQRGANVVEVVLRTLGRGEYFGEQALLHDDCRTASVRALAPGVDCLTLDRESFNALIGSLSELHHKDYAEDTRSQSSRTSFNNDCRKEDEAVHSLLLDDLRPLGTLGVGGFGCVRLVMAPNGRSYALKCLSKRHVAATGQQDHVAAERDVLLAARSSFIVRLLRTFRDEANVYLLLEACLGGEVWALLREHERLPDKAARFVAACVLEALDYLHARDIVYRDLKPENLVMDAEGYVKLVDFGFCKRLPGGCKTWTFCGTPEYVAPEVILNRGHDRAVDYWALGVLIYELLTGAPPFAATDPMGTYKLILLGMESALMPNYMSRTATHLIRRLSRAAPSERLGYQRGNFREVKAHRWFQDFDWDALRTQSMTPPIKPQVSGPTDMSNFYPQTLDEELAPAELSHWDADF